MIAILAALAAAAAPAPAKPVVPRVVGGVCQPCRDLKAIDATIKATYAVISGPPGQKRDFERMRALFAPNALLRVITPKGIRGGTLEEYIAKSGPILEKEGFTERELGRRTELYGDLATAWSLYDGRTASGSFHERGINSFQLVRIDGQWKVASILWQEETPANRLPAGLIGVFK